MAFGATRTVRRIRIQRIVDRHLDRLRTTVNDINRESIPALFTAMARAYARTFDHDDLVQIRSFVGTPAGANYLQRSMDMLSDPDVAEANRAHFARGFSALQPLMEQLRREVAAKLASRRREAGSD